ncbi:IDEAL domain-containing protein [Aneurinibacillus tyrosinisolvens]|uniref:IDEAL domain-containing protein n=1 Tax=Aneurinibacillus tyrosinisolvens TaxID=1443435 RepID=UPI00063EEBED|nr:IDEAL domain-containing protein [Aneurinibacillus tyrosinisolvens]
MKIADWVHIDYKTNRATGFITEITEEKVGIFVTIPKHYGEVKVDKNQPMLAISLLGPDDLPSLIDLALESKDPEWFQALSYELNLWRPGSGLIKRSK